jgi:two-component system chemotaxis response regulator CheY
MANYANKSVLVVDDFKMTIRIVHNLLRQIGFSDLDEAANGAEALGKLRSKSYDLIISDWNMEPMTGIELLRAVRADRTLAQTPFIMITAESKTENVIAAKQAGANNFIVKPFSAEKLGDKVSAIFGQG